MEVENRKLKCGRCNTRSAVGVYVFTNVSPGRSWECASCVNMLASDLWVLNAVNWELMRKQIKRWI